MSPSTASPAPHDLESLSDIEIVALVRRQDRRAFAVMVRRHSPRLLRLLNRYLRDDGLAQDALQDVFLTAYQKIDSFAETGTFRSWLGRIAINRALMMLRRRRGTETELEESLLPTFDEAGCRVEHRAHEYRAVDELLAQKQVRAAVTEAIDRLPDTHRIVLLLRDVEGYSTAEAAEKLEITETAAKVRLHRARAALKKRLEPLLLKGEIL